MKKEGMFNTPNHDALPYLFDKLFKFIADSDTQYVAIIHLMQIKNFIVENIPTDGCDDCAYLSMDTDAVINVCPECAEERGLT